MAAMTLLAKSPKQGQPPKGLAEHSCEVMEAFEALFGQANNPTRLGLEWLRFFRLGAGDFPDFHANGVAASGLHDIGKANDGFQAALERKGEQLLRHEHLSGLVLALPEVDKWLVTLPRVDVDVVLSAVIGHHLKASPKEEHAYPAFAEGLSVAMQSLRLYAEYAEFKACLDAVAKKLGASQCTAKIPRLWTLDASGHQSIDEVRDEISRRFNARAGRALRDDRHRHSLLMAVKAAVVAADAAGSGLVRENLPLRAWLTESFAETLTGDDIERHVIRKRIDVIEARMGQRFEFQPFQKTAAKLPDRALLLAPCGMGKTLAAWCWIEARLNERARGRVLFLYPTRATATEGFRDYVSHAPESDAALLSGTARYELLDMFENPDDRRDGRSYLTEERLYALGFWKKRVFSATVDQFFGFMQQSYSGICLLPVLADSVVVVDEVHSFDSGLFSALRRLLEYFDVPVLCMTASLPAKRREVLEALGLRVFPDSQDDRRDVDRIARLPRYRVVEVKGFEEAERTARQAVAVGRKVLWVVNTVDRCQALAQRLCDLNPLCYHSRFTLDDRKRHHQAVVETFQTTRGSGVIAVTTQVCEMSLDLDAQVLVSEIAPIPSLIQRMGRCNRNTSSENHPLGDVLLYRPEGEAPYEQSDLDLASQFVDDLSGKSVAQSDLEELLEKYSADQEAEGERLMAFIADGFWSRGGSEELREGDDYTVPAVLDSEVEHYLSLRRKGEPADGLVLPVPKRFAQFDARLPGFLRVSPSRHYEPTLGFLKEAPTRERAVIL